MHTLKIISTTYITHNVKRFVVEKPKDFQYRPGQSVKVSINKPNWEDKKRAFSFTSLQDWDHLEFIIKIYKEHDGVTREMASLRPGDEFLLHAVFGTIQYKGPGVFLAGGTGITPFIAIFRALHQSGNTRGVALLYSNHTREDIILHKELTEILGPAYVNVFTREGVIGFRERRIDRKFLIENIGKFDLRFYVCGPKEFTLEVSEALVSLGADPEFLVV